MDRYGYQVQDSAQTLAQALDEYYAVNTGVITRPGDMAAPSRRLFRSHDLCHVIFGLSTALVDEALADGRTLLSTDVGWGRYLHYMRADAEAKKVAAAVRWWTIVWVVLRALPRLVLAGVDAWRMHRRWPWEPPEAYLLRQVGDLRREYGIHVV